MPPGDRASFDHLDELLFGYVRHDLPLLVAGQTVGEALTFLRSAPLGERIVYFYVVDTDQRLVGVVPTRRLLMAELDTPVTQIMVTHVLSLPTSATIRDASDLLLKHRLLALPVVDSEGHLHGVADLEMFSKEFVSATERQSAEDIFQIIGAHATQTGSAWRSFVDRFPWLLCNVGGGLIAAAIAGHYESLLESLVVLALFVPVVLAVSESIAMQSVTLTIQSLHGGRPSFRVLFGRLKREFVTALLLGIGCGATVGAVVWGWKQAPLVAAVVFLTVAMSMATGATIGVVMPGTLRALRRDPRIAAGPIALALTDFVALIFYFNLAQWLLT